MKTDRIQAWQVEEGDTIVLSTNLYLVDEVSDTEEFALNLLDEDGYHETLYFRPDDELILYLGEDDVEFEDVEADPE